MGALRHGDAPRRGPPAASAEEIHRLVWRVGAIASVLVAWAVGSLLATLLIDRVGGLPLAGAAGALGAGALLVFAAGRRAPTRALVGAASLLGTLALAFAIAGHALFWGGASFAAMLPGLPGTIARVAILLFVPLYAGARIAALVWAWRASGSRARSPLLTVEALRRVDPRDLLAPARAGELAPAMLARWAEGAALPGALLLDAVFAARPLADRIHAATDPAELEASLRAHGAEVERAGRDLRVRLGGGVVRVAQGVSLFPPGPTLEVHGDRETARRLRRLLEGEASSALRFAWSAPATRWEFRLNALHDEAARAGSLEERSLVMEELDRVRKALPERALAGSEALVLRLKEASARALLAHRMLSEPPGPRDPSRALAHHAALVPDVARVLDAGGLSAVRRVAFVPHWILPVQTPWGEQEIVVSAATGRLDAAESRALLGAMRARGPSVLVDVGPSAVFLPAPPATAAILRELRAAGLRVLEDVATGETSADVVYVPYLATAEGYLSGITGAPAPDLGASVPVAPHA